MTRKDFELISYLLTTIEDKYNSVNYDAENIHLSTVIDNLEFEEEHKDTVYLKIRIAQDEILVYLFFASNNDEVSMPLKNDVGEILNRLNKMNYKTNSQYHTDPGYNSIKITINK